jgi:hypothetical protein
MTNVRQRRRRDHKFRLLVVVEWMGGRGTIEEIAATCERLGIMQMSDDVFAAFHRGVVFRMRERELDVRPFVDAFNS